MATARDEAFPTFFNEAEPRLRLALVGAFGPDVGREAAADALAWAWQNWDRLDAFANPTGYLYRVGRSAALAEVGRRAHPTVDDALADWAHSQPPDFEPNLLAYLTELTEHQRVAVWLVHGMGFTHREVAEVLACSTPSVATHVRRGLAKLRTRMEVEIDG